MRHAAFLRTILAGRAGVAVTAGTAGTLLAMITLLLVPSQSELVQASLQAADGRGAATAAAALDSGATGNRVLVARSYLASGQASRAAALLTPLAARFPNDSNVAALLDKALAQTGQATAMLARQVAIARRSNNGTAWRRVAALARATDAAAIERDALDHLALGGDVTSQETERLAALEDATGAADTARDRLQRRFALRRDLSPAGLRHLLRLSLPTSSAEAILPVVAAVEASGQAPTRRAVVEDLIAGGRAAAALAVTEQASPRDAPLLWQTRVMLERKVHGDAAARALLTRAAANPGAVPPASLVAIAYLLDDPEAIVLAAERGVIPRLSPALALDLARRGETRAPGLIARIDRLAGGDWRRSDPWLAMRLAERAKDTPAALRYAALLPAAQADAAREAILLRSGDRAALRALLVNRARTAPGTRAAVAERLLAIGFRDDALGMLAEAAASAGSDDAETRRLLYLWGPRPPAAGLAWLNARVQSARDPGARTEWLLLRARRDRPQDGLRVLERDRSADRTEVLLARIDLAAATHDAGAARRALAILLDGRALSPEHIRAATASADDASPALRQALTRRRIDAGVALPHDRLDLAWAAWQGGDVAAARGLVADHLAIDPRDAEALRLMADLEAKAGGERRARPWLQKALTQAEPDSREAATLLARLGRHGEALAIVERLRRETPGDKALVADHARLLVAAGQPGRAQALFAR